MIEPLAEAIAALVGVLANLLARLGELIAWLAMMAFEIVVALVQWWRVNAPKFRRWRMR